MDDFIGQYIGANHLHDWTVIANFVAAVFIGPYLAFASTPDAGLRCLQAFVRLAHRCVLVAMSIALFNNALVVESGNDSTGSAFLVFLCLFVSVIISAVRYRWWMSDIPPDASWRNPHFPHRKTAQAEG